MGNKEKKEKTEENELEKLKLLCAEQAILLEKLQNSQSIFLKNLSQNIRIPLNGIVGMIDVMKMTQISDEQSEYLEIINTYGDSLISIVNDILDYSHIIANELELEERYYFPRKIFNEIDSAYRMRIEGKGLKLNFQIDSNIPHQIYGDPSRIKQVISNLINNSLKYTKEGSITVKLELLADHNSSANNFSKMRFSVIDTGFGMTAEKKKNLQKELDKTKQESFISTKTIGLGLSISQALLRMINSSIFFTTEIEKGSSFSFELTCPSKISKLPSQPVFHPHNGKKLSILLVEDNILNQKFAVATLVKNGHDVIVAENGKIAYDKFCHGKFDLILMDIQMPIMDGVQATLSIREREKELKTDSPIKIVAVTAYAMDRDRDRCLKAGMDKFLAKPFRPDQLIDIIDNLDIN